MVKKCPSVLPEPPIVPRGNGQKRPLLKIVKPKIVDGYDKSTPEGRLLLKALEENCRTMACAELLKADSVLDKNSECGRVFHATKTLGTSDDEDSSGPCKGGAWEIEVFFNEIEAHCPKS